MQETLEQPQSEAPQPGSSPASPGVTDQSVEGGRSDPTVLDAVGTGTPEATAASVEHATEGAHHDAFLGLDSYGWVAAAFLIFAALLIYLKVPKAIGSALDGRAAKIRGELEEARRLREEAERLLGDYQARQRQAAADANAILANARTEAQNIVADAQRQAEAMVTRRSRMAEDRIAAAERAAVQDLRARVATLATDAARRLIAGQTSAAEQVRLTNDAIANLDRQVH